MPAGTLFTALDERGEWGQAWVQSVVAPPPEILIWPSGDADFE